MSSALRRYLAVLRRTTSLLALLSSPNKFDNNIQIIQIDIGFQMIGQYISRAVKVMICDIDLTPTLIHCGIIQTDITLYTSD